MLSWIFKKKAPRVTAPAAKAATLPAATGRSTPPLAERPPVIDWPLKLRQAMGDDSALLALVHASAPLDIAQAALNALTGEEALKRIERELRDKDRRLHRLAKSRLQASVAQRAARAQASRLIETAQALIDEPLIPANRLVALDRAWQALDAALLEPTQHDDFTTALARLSALTRERGDEVLKLERWTAQAHAALAQLRAACTEAANGAQDRHHLAATAATAHEVVESAPSGDGLGALRDAMQAALQQREQVDARLALLDEWLPAQPTSEAAPALDSPPDATTPEASATPADPATRWQQLPPLSDPLLGAALDRRFEQWLHARDHARQARRAQRSEQTKDQQRASRRQVAASVATLLDEAEAALAAGHLADTGKRLMEIDALAHRADDLAELHSRSERVQAEYARLKGWQHWSGGLAREELVLQAEALAAATGDADASVAKLPVKQQSDLIDDLRGRWKELDRLGGATSRSLWQRFDEALTAAYQPVAAHLAAQRAMREQNLQARQQLVEALNAVGLPDIDDAAASAPDWKLIAAELDRFHTEWRRLGPIQHTVPHQERGALVERMEAAVQRLDVRLNEARRVSQIERERLVARAKALGAEAQAQAGAPGRQSIERARELQSEWQQQAKALPLSRGAESALWTEFRTAIDAVFRAREAAFSARDAEFQAHSAERDALARRLEGLSADTPLHELRRTLAEVDAQWQQAGPAPRQNAAALEARFRSARDAARALMAARARGDWHAMCDAMVAKLALCEEREASTDRAAWTAALQQRWDTLPALPPAWEQALAHRAAATDADPATATPIASSPANLLLQLEAAWELPSPPAFEEARRDLKLQAMKASLEGRSRAAVAPPDSLLATVLGLAGLDEVQRQRLRALVAALRERGPAHAGNQSDV
jgi:hypothetical protein